MVGPTLTPLNEENSFKLPSWIPKMRKTDKNKS